MLKNSLVLGLAVALSASAMASNPVETTIQTDRYTQVSLEPVREILQPLDVVINMTIPKQMALVGEALEFLLLRSGYQIKQPESVVGGEMYILFSLPIPSQHREMGTLRLATALEVLAGNAYQMHTNNVTRQIWFGLKEEMKEDLIGVDLDVYKDRWNNRNMSNSNTVSLVQNFDQVLEKNIDVAAYRTNDNRLNRLSTLIPGTVYGPIISGETLGGVAVRIHAGRATLSQKLIALFEANSHAFMGENMNKLKVGEVLHIPNLEIIERYDSYHAEEVQTDQFRDYLTEVLAYER